MRLRNAFLPLLAISTIAFAAPSGAATTEAKQAKIVSLAPSNTELIYSLGAENKLRGVSTYCTYPPEARHKRKVGSFISVNWERLASIKPDVVLLVSGQEQLALQLKKHNFKSVTLNNQSLDDIAKNLLTIGEISNCQARAEHLASSYRRSINALKGIVKDEPRQKVFYCVWPKPIVTVGGGSFLNDVITVCGGINVAANIRSSYPKYSPEKIIGAQPDLVVMPHESRTIDFKKVAPWSLLSAFKTNNVYFLPDRESDYLSRPTLRIFEGLCQLAERIHPGKKTSLRNWLAHSAAIEKKPVARAR